MLVERSHFYMNFTGLNSFFFTFLFSFAVQWKTAACGTVTGRVGKGSERLQEQNRKISHW